MTATRPLFAALALVLSLSAGCDSDDSDDAKIEALLSQNLEELKAIRSELETYRGEREAAAAKKEERASRRISPRDRLPRTSPRPVPTGPATPLPMPSSSPPTGDAGPSRPLVGDAAKASEALAKSIESITCEVGRCEIPRASVDLLLQSPALLAKQARVVPSMRDGEAQGMKFYGIRRGSLPKAFGIKNGDMITTVNGLSIASPDAALSTYTQLKDAKSLTLEITRKGQLHTLEIVFK